MAKNIRYYITCDDDRPVVHTVPVAVRKDETTAAARPAGEPDASAASESHPQRSTRVVKLVRSAVRRAPAVR